MAQDRDLHVFGVGRWAQPDETDELPDDHEGQGSQDHDLILPSRHRAWSTTATLKLHPTRATWRRSTAA
jgi:hypothetical protein